MEGLADITHSEKVLVCVGSATLCFANDDCLNPGTELYIYH